MNVLGVILVSVSLISTAQQRRVERILRENPAFRGAQTGILAVRGGSDTLCAVNPELRLVPASNVKLITSGAALTALGPQFKFETKIAFSGEVRDSVLLGDLYIIGGADPTLGSPYRSSAPADTLFSRWTAMVRRAGIRRIEGRVVGDGRWLDGQRECPSWCYEDLGTYYGAGPSGLNFYENVQDFDVTPGLSVGEKPAVWATFPDTPWMHWSYDCVTAAAGTGDQLYLYNTDLAPWGEMRGSFAVDRKPKTLHCSNRFPELTCAHLFLKYLESAGVEVVRGCADVSRDGLLRPASSFPFPDGPAADSTVALGSTFSAPLSTILTDLNHQSDNFYAETLLRTLGRSMHSSACYDSSYVALRDVLSRMGLGRQYRSVRVVDGSGLSRENYVSASFFVSFLSKMAAGRYAKTFRTSLPRPGEGTLASRLASKPQALRSRVWMKSGSMDGVRCFSGYVLPPEGSSAGPVVFSVLVNNMTLRGAAASKAVEELVVAIAEE